MCVYTLQIKSDLYISSNQTIRKQNIFLFGKFLRQFRDFLLNTLEKDAALMIKIGVETVVPPKKSQNFLPKLWLFAYKIKFFIKKYIRITCIYFYFATMYRVLRKKLNFEVKGFFINLTQFFIVQKVRESYY